MSNIALHENGNMYLVERNPYTSISIWDTYHTFTGRIVPELKYQEVLEMRKNFTIGLYGIFEVGGSPKCLPTPYAAASYNTPLNLLHWKLDCYVNLTCHRNTMGWNSFWSIFLEGHKIRRNLQRTIFDVTMKCYM